MGRYVIKVPDIGEGMTEAEIVAWHVKPGQVIREEDPLVDVMTDKATVELPAPVAGTVLAIHGNPGEGRPVGSDLVVLDVLGEGNAADAVLEATSTELGVSPAQPLTPPAGRGREAGRLPDRTQSDSRGEREAEHPQTVPLPARGEREGQVHPTTAAPIRTTRL